MQLKIIVLSSLLACTLGCLTHHQLRPEAVRVLDGYDAQASSPEDRVRVVQNVAGETVEFRASGKLHLVPKGVPMDGEADIGDEFARVEVRSGEFRGWRGDGESVAFKIDQLEGAVLTQSSPLKTALLVSIIVLAVPATLAATAGIGCASGGCGMGSMGSWR